MFQFHFGMARWICWMILTMSGVGMMPGLIEAQNTMEYFVEQGQKNSPLLNDINNQLVSNVIDSMKLRAAYGFVVTADGNGMYAPDIKGWGYDNALTNGQTLFAGFTASRQLIGNANLDARLSAFNAHALQIIAFRNVSVQSLKNQITSQYIATYSSQLNLDLTNEIIHILEEEDIILKKLTRDAAFRQTDYLAFQVTLQQNLLTLEQQKTDWLNNYSLLKYLCGIIDTNYVELKTPDIPDVVNPLGFKESVYAGLFRADSIKLANDALIIEYEYKPKVSAISNVGYQSSFAATPYKNWGMSIGLAFTLPIYDGRQKNLSLSQNKLSQETRLNYQQQTERQYVQKALQLHQQLAQYEKMMKIAETQIHYAQTLVEANGKQLPTGDVKMADFILSINNLLNLRTNMISYRTNILQIKNQIQNLTLQ